MTKTTQYQLNQWDASDRVLREDFNRDNAKIDAAIAEAKDACPYVQLLALTTAENLTRIDLPLTGIEPETFHRMDLYVFPSQTGDDWADTVYLRANGLSSGYLRNNTTAAQLAVGGLGGSAGDFGYLCFHLYLGQKIPGTAEYFYVDHSYYTDDNVNESFSEDFYALEQSPANLQSIQLDGWNGGEKPLPAGTRVQLYGLKK